MAVMQLYKQSNLAYDFPGLWCSSDSILVLSVGLSTRPIGLQSRLDRSQRL